MNPVTNAQSDSPAPFHPASSPDYLPRDLLRALQSQRLRQVVNRAYEHVSLYRQRMHKHGLTPADIRGVDDLARLPFTLTADLSHEYPFGMMAVPPSEALRLHAVNGTAGKPLVVSHTRRDLETWHEVVVRSLAACGVQPGDILQNACGSHLFTDGLALHCGAEILGATVIPSPAADNARQLAILKDLSVSAICCTPSFFLHLIERAEKSGVDLRDFPLRVGVWVAEPWTQAMRRRAEEAAGIRAYGIYSLSEILGPGVGVECCQQNGLHLFEDHFYPEIVDPATGNLLPDGQEGELVLTTLSREAMPLVRYRTSQRTAILAETCPCGRTLRRIRRVEQPAEQVFLVEGVHVFPAQIEAVLLAVEGVLPPYQIVRTQEGGRDQFEVQIEVTAQIFRDQVGAMENLQSKLASEIERAVGIRVPVRFVEPHTIARHREKPQPAAGKAPQ